MLISVFVLLLEYGSCFEETDILSVDVFEFTNG